jgi:nucleoside-diphosphate-sugar epimerase
VLVTGASGFIGSHGVLQLLQHDEVVVSMGQSMIDHKVV